MLVRVYENGILKIVDDSKKQNKQTNKKKTTGISKDINIKQGQYKYANILAQYSYMCKLTKRK